MSTRYVAVAQNMEGGARAFGTYHSRLFAERFADRVNGEIEAREDAEYKLWRNDDEKEGPAPDGYGRVHVLVIHRPNHDAALGFALDLVPVQR